VAPVAGWNGRHGRDVQRLVWAVNDPDHVIATTFPKLASNVLVTQWRQRNALLVSAKCGLAGRHGQYVLVMLAKCAAMDHDLVSVVALVSLESRVAAETQSKRAHVLLARVSGASGTRRLFARQSNPDAALAQRLTHVHATEDQACVQAPHRKRKCVNSTRVLASPSGEIGQLAQ
jgi:hypothetical protein